MGNWQITAATLRCDTVNDEVTLLVYRDWSVKCTGAAKHTQTGRGNGRRVCQGTNCSLAQAYLKRLRNEEQTGTVAENRT